MKVYRTILHPLEPVQAARFFGVKRHGYLNEDAHLLFRFFLDADAENPCRIKRKEDGHLRTGKHAVFHQRIATLSLCVHLYKKSIEAFSISKLTLCNSQWKFLMNKKILCISVNMYIYVQYVQ